MACLPNDGTMGSGWASYADMIDVPVSNEPMMWLAGAWLWQK